MKRLISRLVDALSVQVLCVILASLVSIIEETVDPSIKHTYTTDIDLDTVVKVKESISALEVALRAIIYIMPVLPSSVALESCLYTSYYDKLLAYILPTASQHDKLSSVTKVVDIYHYDVVSYSKEYISFTMMAYSTEVWISLATCSNIQLCAFGILYMPCSVLCSVLGRYGLSRDIVEMILGRVEYCYRCKDGFQVNGESCKDMLAAIHNDYIYLYNHITTYNALYPEIQSGMIIREYMAGHEKQSHKSNPQNTKYSIPTVNVGRHLSITATASRIALNAQGKDRDMFDGDSERLGSQPVNINITNNTHGVTLSLECKGMNCSPEAMREFITRICESALNVSMQPLENIAKDILMILSTPHDSNHQDLVTMFMKEILAYSTANLHQTATLNMILQLLERMDVKMPLLLLILNSLDVVEGGSLCREYLAYFELSSILIASMKERISLSMLVRVLNVVHLPIYQSSQCSNASNLIVTFIHTSLANYVGTDVTNDNYSILLKNACLSHSFIKVLQQYVHSMVYYECAYEPSMDKTLCNRVLSLVILTLRHSSQGDILIMIPVIVKYLVTILKTSNSHHHIIGNAWNLLNSIQVCCPTKEAAATISYFTYYKEDLIQNLDLISTSLLMPLYQEGNNVVTIVRDYVSALGSDIGGSNPALIHRLKCISSLHPYITLELMISMLPHSIVSLQQTQVGYNIVKGKTLLVDLFQTFISVIGPVIFTSTRTKLNNLLTSYLSCMWVVVEGLLDQHILKRHNKDATEIISSLVELLQEWSSLNPQGFRKYIVKPFTTHLSNVSIYSIFVYVFWILYISLFLCVIDVTVKDV